MVRRVPRANRPPTGVRIGDPMHLPLFDFVPWHRIVWLCGRCRNVDGAVHPEAPFTGAPDPDAGKVCELCGRPAKRSCTVPTPFHDDPSWAWAPGTRCGCGTCARKRGRCRMALEELVA